jgi:predicted nucleotidyltransferase
MRWPAAGEVDTAVRTWARNLVGSDRNVVAVGYFGSYARGDWGPGSDLDVVILVRSSDAPLVGRIAPGDATLLPVPTDVLTYTPDEWRQLGARGGRFAETLARELRWVAGEPPDVAPEGAGDSAEAV